MEYEILQSIKENLPEQAGQIIQQELLELKNLRKDYADLGEDNRKLKKQISDQSDTITELKLQHAGHVELDQREGEISKRERDLELEILKIQLNSEQDKSKFAMETTMGLVRNTEFKKVLDVSNALNDSSGGFSSTLSPETVGQTNTAE